MSKKTILILGSGGMCGHIFYKYLNSLNKYKIYDIARTKVNPNTIVLDIKKEFYILETAIKEFMHPDIIINCVGILVKESEQNPENAIWINSYFPHFLEDVTRGTQTKIIHLSTDCVFNGQGTGYYQDTDEPNGVGVYARSKALGEINNGKDLTVRMSIIGPELKKTGTGLFSWFLSQKGQVKGYNGVYFNGISTLELARAMDKIIDSNITGLYHLAPNYKIDKYSLLCLFQKIWDKTDISIVPDNELMQDKSLLNSDRQILGYQMPFSYEEMLIDLKEYMDETRPV